MPTAPQSGRPPKPVPRFGERRLYHSPQRRPFRAGRRSPWAASHTAVCALCRGALHQQVTVRIAEIAIRVEPAFQLRPWNRDTAAVGCDGAKSWDKDTPVRGRGPALAELAIAARRGVCLLPEMPRPSIGKRVRPPASSTARALKAPKKAAHTSIPRVMMRARRSTARSGISWWIPRAC